MEPLTSQRFVPSSYHARPSNTTDMLRGLTLHEPYQIPKSYQQRGRSNIPKQPFRLLDLPVELQRLIYTHYFGPWSVTLDHERFSMLRSKVHVQGVPSTSLLRTCRAVQKVASEVRERYFTGCLFLNSVFVLVTLRKKTGFGWLKQNIRTLHFSDSSVRPERWYRYYEGFERLERLEIDFPKLVRLDRDCLEVERILKGEADEALLESLQEFRFNLVGDLGSKVSVVVGQSYCLKEHLIQEGWKGVLSVKILLVDQNATILERKYDPGVDVISKRQFRVMHEL